MGYKNSLDSATLVNKCLELVEAHYLFDIPFNKLDILIHPQALVHSIFEFQNYVTNMVYFYHDMNIPLFNFFNQKFYYIPKNNIDYNFKKNNLLKFSQIKNSNYPIYDFFKKLDKNDPRNIIKFNLANEFAVNLFKNKKIIYTDIVKIIKKITLLNLNSSVNTINEVLEYHNEFEHKINSFMLIKNKIIFSIILIFYSFNISAKTYTIEIIGNDNTDTEVVYSLLDKKPESLNIDYSNYLLKTLNQSGLFKNVRV